MMRPNWMEQIDCKNGARCHNIKCGFKHPDNWIGYSAEMKKFRTMPYIEYMNMQKAETAEMKHLNDEFKSLMVHAEKPKAEKAKSSSKKAEKKSSSTKSKSKSTSAKKSKK